MNRNHAVVIGGSMAGLVGARVLSSYFKKVTLIERDTFPAVGQHRRGVPQGVHTHGLLVSGRRVLERWFPGLGAELIAAGAVEGDILRDSRWFFEGGCLNRCVCGLDGLLMSRPFLEGTVRKHLLAIANIEARENQTVDGLVATEDGRRVTGVRIGNESMNADLVVDATGRGSKGPAWLESLGYSKPSEDRVEVGIAYATRLFRRRKDQMGGDCAAVIPPTPEGKRGGVMLAQEGERWTVTLIAHFRECAPLDLNGFVAFAKLLPAPYIYEVIRESEPIGEGISARFPASTRRRYEKLARFPKGYLAFGDSICSFNPIYGQGMSVACLQSVALDETLGSGVAEDQLAGDFFTRASKVVDIPWSIAVGSDLRIPETVGPRSAGVSFINWYIAKLHKTGHHDPVAAQAFLRVANLLEPPPSILHPRVAVRVFLGSLKPRTAGGATENYAAAERAD